MHETTSLAEQSKNSGKSMDFGKEKYTVYIYSH